MTVNHRSRKRSRKRGRHGEGRHGDLPVQDDGFVEVRGGNGRLLFRYDAVRDLVEVKPKGGVVEVVDLRQLRVED